MLGIIIGFDIKDYSQNASVTDMNEQRKTLSNIILDTTKNLEIFNQKDTVDTGDGCFLLLNTGDFEKILLAMEQIQLKADEANCIIFRGIVHIGPYYKTKSMIDDNTINYIGEGINTASRYLNADCLKELLASNDKHFVYGISSEFYEYAIGIESFEQDNYQRYRFQEKKFSGTIFLHTKNLKFLPKQEIIAENYRISNIIKRFIIRVIDSIILELKPSPNAEPLEEDIFNMLTIWLIKIKSKLSFSRNSVSLEKSS